MRIDIHGHCYRTMSQPFLNDFRMHTATSTVKAVCPHNEKGQVSLTPGLHIYRLELVNGNATFYVDGVTGSL